MNRGFTPTVHGECHALYTALRVARGVNGSLRRSIPGPSPGRGFVEGLQIFGSRPVTEGSHPLSSGEMSLHYRVLPSCLTPAALAAGFCLSPLLAGTGLATALLLTVGAAQAAAADVRSYAIAAGPLELAVNEFARQAGLLLSFDPKLVAGKRSAGLSGSYTSQDGIAALLTGSGVGFRFVDARTVLLEAIPVAAGDGATLLSAVKVQARAQDAGSEGTRAYAARATTIGKSNESLREIPQSVSVITREQLNDQNASSLPDALKYVTGVTVKRFDGAGYFNTFNARGYTTDTVQLDGINVQYNANMADTDLAVYDRVEIQRGAAGLFQGAGEPGVMLNLARKRALAETQLQGLFSAGSWDSYRAEADLSGALDAAGRLRGRAVLVWDDRDSYMDGIFGKKKLGYGTVEYDLRPDTTLSLGAIWQKVDSVINQGLPAYADGTLIDVPRSTAYVADWNDLDMKTADYFGEIEHRLSGGGLAKLHVRHLDRSRLYAGTRGNGAVDPVTGNFALANVYYYTRLDDTAADLFVSLPFSFAGRTHELVAGADYRTAENGTPLKYNLRFDPAIAQSNIDTHDQHSAEPDTVYGGYGATMAETEQYGGYLRARLRATDAFSALLGARLTWWESKTRNLETEVVSGKYDANSEVTPYAALMFDLNPSLSVYASYADIFKPQNNQTKDLKQIKPRSGAQVETGIKGEFLDGRINTHAAVYRMEDKNRALTDPTDDQFYIAAGKIRSEGFETEVSGEVLSHWQLTAGYAYVKTEYLNATEDQEGQPFAPDTPKHVFNLWTKYSFTQDALTGLDVGGGVRAVSKFYAGSDTLRFVGAGYTTLALQAGYKLSPHFSLAANIDNVLDRKYYEKVSYAGRQNFYGAPRSFMLTLRGNL